MRDKLKELRTAAKLRDMTADDLNDWLEDKAAELATSTLREILSILRRSITLAQRRDLTWVGDTGIEPVTSSV